MFKSEENILFSLVEAFHTRSIQAYRERVREREGETQVDRFRERDLRRYIGIYEGEK